MKFLSLLAVTMLFNTAQAGTISLSEFDRKCGEKVLAPKVEAQINAGDSFVNPQTGAATTIKKYATELATSLYPNESSGLRESDLAFTPIYELEGTWASPAELESYGKTYRLEFKTPAGKAGYIDMNSPTYTLVQPENLKDFRAIRDETSIVA
jgi:hypothetical protein